MNVLMKMFSMSMIAMKMIQISLKYCKCTRINVVWHRQYYHFGWPIKTNLIYLIFAEYHLFLWYSPVESRGNMIQFNIDEDYNHTKRSSYEGTITIVDGLPLNPKGRTGLTGRGTLYRWGPNHCVDCIVTRYCNNLSYNIDNVFWDIARNNVIYMKCIHTTIIYSHCRVI